VTANCVPVSLDIARAQTGPLHAAQARSLASGNAVDQRLIVALQTCVFRTVFGPARVRRVGFGDDQQARGVLVRIGAQCGALMPPQPLKDQSPQWASSALTNRAGGRPVRGANHSAGLLINNQGRSSSKETTFNGNLSAKDWLSFGLFAQSTVISWPSSVAAAAIGYEPAH